MASQKEQMDALTAKLEKADELNEKLLLSDKSQKEQMDALTANYNELIEKIENTTDEVEPNLGNWKLLDKLSNDIVKIYGVAVVGQNAFGAMLLAVTNDGTQSLFYDADIRLVVRAGEVDLTN